jgi:hypothetical protein
MRSGQRIRGSPVPKTPPHNPNAVENLRADAALRHGAHSPERIAPAREQHLDTLRERFPDADVTILGLQATRLAILELIGEWLGPRGIIRNRRTGTTWPCADYWAKTASAFERQQERLEAQHRVADPQAALAAALADGGEAWRRARPRLTEGTADD